MLSFSLNGESSTDLPCSVGVVEGEGRALEDSGEGCQWV